MGLLLVVGLVGVKPGSVVLLVLIVGLVRVGKGPVVLAKLILVVSGGVGGGVLLLVPSLSGLLKSNRLSCPNIKFIALPTASRLSWSAPTFVKISCRCSLLTRLRGRFKPGSDLLGQVHAMGRLELALCAQILEDSTPAICPALPWSRMK